MLSCPRTLYRIHEIFPWFTDFCYSGLSFRKLLLCQSLDYLWAERNLFYWIYVITYCTLTFMRVLLVLSFILSLNMKTDDCSSVLNSFLNHSCDCDETFMSCCPHARVVSEGEGRGWRVRERRSIAVPFFNCVYLLTLMHFPTNTIKNKKIWNLLFLSPYSPVSLQYVIKVLYAFQFLNQLGDTPAHFGDNPTWASLTRPERGGFTLIGLHFQIWLSPHLSIVGTTSAYGLTRPPFSLLIFIYFPLTHTYKFLIKTILLSEEVKRKTAFLDFGMRER